MARFPFVALLLLVPLAAFAQFAGSYVYQGPQGAVTLTLQQQDNAVSGSMRGVDGSVIQFEGMLRDNGKAIGGIARGRDGSGIFLAKWVDGRLTLTLAETDPATGRVNLDQTLQLGFARVQRSAQPQAATKRESAAAAPAAPSSERDPALVGHWVYSSVYRSGDFSGTSMRQWLVRPEGTYRMGYGAVQVSGSDSFGRSESGDFTPGHWRTKDRILYVSEGGSQWVPYARYYVERGKLLLTFNNGSKQLWQLR
jgi:hypothetical protein